MAEFPSTFCCPFLPSVLIIEGFGGMAARVAWGGTGRGGRGERGQKPLLGTPCGQP